MFLSLHTCDYCFEILCCSESTVKLLQWFWMVMHDYYSFALWSDWLPLISDLQIINLLFLRNCMHLWQLMSLDFLQCTSYMRSCDITASPDQPNFPAYLCEMFQFGVLISKSAIPLLVIILCTGVAQCSSLSLWISSRIVCNLVVSSINLIGHVLLLLLSDKLLRSVCYMYIINL